MLKVKENLIENENDKIKIILQKVEPAIKEQINEAEKLLSEAESKF